MTEYGYDIGNMKAWADKEMTMEIKMSDIPEDALQKILGGIPIVRCKDCLACTTCLMGQYLGLEGFCSKGELKEET